MSNFVWRDKDTLDAAVVEYLTDPNRCNGGASYWAIAEGLNEADGNVAASLKRLKRRGRVFFNGPTRAWKVT